MKRVMVVVIFLALLLLPTRAARARSQALEGRVIIGQNFTLKSGETLEGDLVVIGGQASIEAMSAVKGDVVILGGSLQLDGAVSGDAVVIGGTAALGKAATLSGDVITVGGSLQREAGAYIGGNVITNMPPPSIALPKPAPVPTTPSAARRPSWPDFGPLGRIVALFFQAVALSALAMVLTALLHPQLDRAADAALKQPLIAGSLGLLTVVLAALGSVILAVTLILIPVAMALVLALALAWLFGVVALGLALGEWITRAVHRTWEPVLSAGAGAFVLVIVAGAVGSIPCIGWLASVLIGLTGLGAAVMTAFGTRAGPRPTGHIASDVGAGAAPSAPSP